MTRIWALVSVVALAVSACGGSDDVEAGSGEGLSSPIAEFLGQEQYSFGGDNEAAEQRFIEDERARQELIAACMREQGFEYTPVDPAETIFFGPGGEDEWGSEEWVAEYGFGYTTQWFSQSEVGPELVGYDDAQMQEQEVNDPNQEAIDAMSESEQEAYYAALYGDPDDFPAFDESMTEEEIEAQMEGFEFEPSGCQGEAFAEDETSAFYQEFNDEISEMYERIESDPRIIEAQQEVASCVTDKGFDFTDEQAFYEEIEGELMAIDQRVNESMPTFSDEEMADMTPEQMDELFSGRTLTDEDKADLAELQAREIDVAVAVHECGGGFGNQQQMLMEVVAEYEQLFLEDNADAVAKYRAER
ncbi:MAG: hypothetical protein ACFCVK_23910 [Acidimicrobiales bacterium]